MRFKIAVGILLLLLLLTGFATCRTAALCDELQKLLSTAEEAVEADDFAAAHAAVREFRATQKKAGIWFTVFVDRAYRFEFFNNCASFEKFMSRENCRDFLAEVSKARATLDIISSTMLQII